MEEKHFDLFHLRVTWMEKHPRTSSESSTSVPFCILCPSML